MMINFDILPHKPLMIVISGPSGVGKDTVIHELKRRKFPIHFVITANTRAPRTDEREGVDYFFVSKENFLDMIARDELIEYSPVYNDFKGIPKAQVVQALESGMDVIMRLDVQGAEKIRKIYPDALLIFIVPENEKEWFLRLKTRAGEPPEDLELRIRTAQMELGKVHLFDYVVVNSRGKLEDAVDIVTAIITAEHHRTSPRSISS